MINTYGVYGKVEFAISITIGTKTCMVDFEGGSTTSRGVRPATYRTNNPVMQSIIESSSEYKVGVIQKISSAPEAQDLVTAQKMEEGRKLQQEQMESDDTADDAPSAETEDKEPAPEENLAPVPTVPTPPAAEPVEVKVTCLDDAVEYLKAHYEGYTSSKLRSKAAVERAAEEHGIVFVGL